MLISIGKIDDTPEIEIEFIKLYMFAQSFYDTCLIQLLRL